MRILVLNGSPKGEDSITLQTVRYWEKKFHQEFEVLHVCLLYTSDAADDGTLV